MNYLAHLLLSGPDRDIQVGGLLGDFVKGPLTGALPQKVEFGIYLHRKLDVVTDQHPAFLKAAEVVPPEWRRFRGILLDVYFDNLLASDWKNYHPQPLPEFCQHFYQSLTIHQAHLPPRAQHFCSVAPQVKWLESYAYPENIPTMLNNMAKRMKRPVLLGGVVSTLEKERDFIKEQFQLLITDLLLFSQDLRREHQPL